MDKPVGNPRLHGSKGTSARVSRRLRIVARALLAGWVMAQAAGCTLFAPITSKLRAQREVYHFDHPFGVESPAFRRSLETFGSPLVAGNEVRLLNNGDEIFPAMLGAIADAKRSVNMETYIFNDDETSRRFADALIAAVRRGVEVRGGQVRLGITAPDGVAVHREEVWRRLAEFTDPPAGGNVPPGPPATRRSSTPNSATRQTASGGWPRASSSLSSSASGSARGTGDSCLSTATGLPK